MSFTYSYVTLHSYQNTLKYISEPRINPIIINIVIKVYELK